MTGGPLVSPSAAPGHHERLHAIDWLRGIVMVLMALDHCRDYFGDIRLDPVDLDTTTPALFFTRWVTHFCAPTFVFLAGTAAWLHGARGLRTTWLSFYLATRGLWLIVLEFTAVSFAWTLSFALGIWFLQVIAAIGAAMVALSVLVFLPGIAIAAIGLLLVAGHNALDTIHAAQLGPWRELWIVLHQGSTHGAGPIVLAPGFAVLVIYPLLPWIGVMALGYAFGPVCRQPRTRRRLTCLLLGTALVAGFVALRAGGVYGDPRPWQPGSSGVMAVMSFLNCEKYPPSLLYLLMTLGPALLALAWLDREPGPVGRAAIVFGRVPLFYYVLHLYLIHLGSRLLYWVTEGEPLSSLQAAFRGQFPSWYGHSLWGVYAAWLLVVLALYPLCRWYGEIKRRSRSSLFSYL